MTRIEQTINEAKEKGIAHISTCDAPNWSRKAFTLDIDYNALRTQKRALLDILSDDNNKDAVEAAGLDGILNLLDSIQDQAVDQHGIPEKEVFHLSEDAVNDEPSDIFRELNLRPYSKGEDEDCTDIEHPVTASPVYDSVAFAQGQIKMFDAYQHFLYYFDEKNFRENSPIGSEHMTNHFMDKLAGYRRIHSPEGNNSIMALVTWIQNMSPVYQDSMLGYMLKYHSGKGVGFRSWE